MKQYRIYCLDDEGSFSNAEEVMAASDEDAVAQARALKHPGFCEVWEANRLVARIEAYSAA